MTEKLTFGESISKCLRKYGTFKGRASKREYLWFALLLFAVEWPLLLVSLESGLVYQLLEFMFFVLTVSFLVPSFAAGSRRLHDSNHSGKNLLWLLLPLIGWAIFVKLATQDGDKETNFYGDPDNGPFTPIGHRTSMVDLAPEEPKETPRPLSDLEVENINA